MRIPVPIVTALVLEEDFHTIFNAVNIFFDDICN